MAANILVVEDDADINEIISTQLSRNGHTCTQAFSGTEALMRLDPNGGPLPYDLVICDLMLPGATGEQIIDSVRRADSALPVIVISARTSTADRVELLKLGADDYLTKPFDLDELAARAEVQLRHRSKQRGPRTNESRVTVHISNIRAKLKPSGTDAYIKTVWGIGFRLDEDKR